MPDKNTALRNILNRSGVPFQLAAEQAIRSIGAGYGIQVIGREVPWSGGFLDILARRQGVLLAFECKRVEDTMWIFVLSDEEQERQTRCRLEWFNSRAPHPRIPMLRHSRVFCSEWNHVEGSPESDFCVVPKGKPINSLEEVCRELLAGCHEILGDEELAHTSDYEVMVPVILTNARLVTCRFEPSSIDRATGTLADQHGEFTDVPFIRFRKTLSVSRSNWYDSTPLVHDEFIVDRERTVFVVTPAGLPILFHGLRAFSCMDPEGVPREFRDPPPTEEIVPLNPRVRRQGTQP